MDPALVNEEFSKDILTSSMLGVVRSGSTEYIDHPDEISRDGEIYLRYNLGADYTGATYYSYMDFAYEDSTGFVWRSSCYDGGTLG